MLPSHTHNAQFVECDTNIHRFHRITRTQSINMAICKPIAQHYGWIYRLWCEYATHRKYFRIKNEIYKFITHWSEFGWHSRWLSPHPTPTPKPNHAAFIFQIQFLFFYLCIGLLSYQICMPVSMPLWPFKCVRKKICRIHILFRDEVKLELRKINGFWDSNKP